MESLKARHAAGDNKSPYAEPLHIVFGTVGIFALCRKNNRGLLKSMNGLENSRRLQFTKCLSWSLAFSWSSDSLRSYFNLIHSSF